VFLPCERKVLPLGKDDFLTAQIGNSMDMRRFVRTKIRTLLRGVKKKSQDAGWEGFGFLVHGEKHESEKSRSGGSGEWWEVGSNPC